MSTAGAAAAAAAAAQQVRNDEEETMTPYSDRELDEGWEFKIVRSATATFRDPAKLRAVLDEEARAGWTLVEKFDDQRLRLKRPAQSRNLDPKLDFDPYRTQVGTTDAKLAVLILAGIAGALALLILIAFAFRR